MKTLEQRLEEKFKASELHWQRPPRRTAFVWTSCKGRSGTRYGSYKTVYEDELAQRGYILEWCDETVGIFYTDMMYVD